MQIFLEDFEKDRKRHFAFEVEPDAAKALFEDTEVTPTRAIEVDVDVERVGKTIIVTGEVRGELGFQCGKCLRERTHSFSAEADWVLMNRGEWESRYGDEDEVELNEDDLDVSFYEGEEISLDSLVREAVILELPAQLKCPDDDPDCEAEYQRLIGEDVMKENEEASMDLRWAPLKNIKLSDSKD